MVDSTQATPDHGLMTVASAYRAKYRKCDSGGKAEKLFVRVGGVGVHKQNRGGVYPSGVRCKSLCEEVMENGFLKEEVNHACIVVEEPPVEHAVLHAAVAGPKSSASYNAEQCAKDELLVTCFKPPFDSVHFSLLSHNHIMLVLRAVLTNAKWDIPNNIDKGICVCDADGKLSVAAVAGSPNGKQLAEMLVEGMHAEVLCWQMDVEQPDAASLISQAQNLPSQTAMRTSELTAVQLLKGEIIRQLGKDLSQRVAFQTVRDQLRAQLHSIADDPDLPEVFDFLVSSGVGQNGFVDELLDWAARYVDSKKRQLRLSAFSVINKMCEEAVWSRVAVIKRAYRKQPTNGYCASPEKEWGDFRLSQLQILEDMLRFFHVSCKDIIDGLTPQLRIQLCGNVDTQAAEAFWLVRNGRGTKNVADEKVRANLLQATAKYLAPLGLDKDATKLMSLPGRASWIDFTASVNELQEEKEAVTNKTAPKVVFFNEATGMKTSNKGNFDAETVTKPRQKVPWREWYSGIGPSVGRVEGDKAAAVAVLQGIHATFDVVKQPIEVWQDHASKTWVTASRSAKPGDIVLPPCVPKASRVVEQSEHNWAIPIKMISKASMAEAVNEQAAVEANGTTYYVLPEFKVPEKADERAAVADAKRAQKQADAAGESDAADASEDEAAVADVWVWGPPGQVTMNPFWAVRRMTQKQMRLCTADDTGSGERCTVRFNCKLERHVLSCVTVGVVQGTESVNTTRVAEVLFLTNTVDVDEGEELVLEVTEKTAKGHAPTKRTWVHAFKDEEKKAKQQRVAVAAKERE